MGGLDLFLPYAARPQSGVIGLQVQLFSTDVKAQSQIFSGVQRKAAVVRVAKLKIPLQIPEEPMNIKIIFGRLRIVMQQLVHGTLSVLEEKVDPQTSAVPLQIGAHLGQIEVRMIEIVLVGGEKVHRAVNNTVPQGRRAAGVGDVQDITRSALALNHRFIGLDGLRELVQDDQRICFMEQLQMVMKEKPGVYIALQPDIPGGNGFDPVLQPPVGALKQAQRHGRQVPVQLAVYIRLVVQAFILMGCLYNPVLDCG